MNSRREEMATSRVVMVLPRAKLGGDRRKKAPPEPVKASTYRRDSRRLVDAPESRGAFSTLARLGIRPLSRQDPSSPRLRSRSRRPRTTGGVVERRRPVDVEPIYRMRRKAQAHLAKANRLRHRVVSDDGLRRSASQPLKKTAKTRPSNKRRQQSASSLLLLLPEKKTHQPSSSQEEPDQESQGTRLSRRRRRSSLGGLMSSALETAEQLDLCNEFLREGLPFQKEDRIPTLATLWRPQRVIPDPLEQRWRP